MRRRLIATSVGLQLIVGLLAGATAPTSAAAPSVQTVHRAQPVLGYKRFAGTSGSGWGKAHPKTIDNGGDPSGIVDHLRWTHWGHKKAFGKGKTFVNKPQGGFYRRPATIRLRASDLGMCHRKLAYKKLYYRVAKKPGGRIQKHWHPWAVKGGDICQHAFG
jgi:hypothetical protein